MDRATVYWTDCHGGDVQASPRELDAKHCPIIIESTAWVWKDDEVGITLIVDNRDNPENDTLGVEDYRNTMFIPRACIRQVEYLEPKDAPTP